jgi:uncharacterized protein
MKKLPDAQKNIRILLGHNFDVLALTQKYANLKIQGHLVNMILCRRFALFRPHNHPEASSCASKIWIEKTWNKRQVPSSSSMFNRRGGLRYSASSSASGPNPPYHSIRLQVSSFLIGSCAGCLGSLAGMGGGFVLIPMLTSSVMRLSQHQAHATSLFAVTATGIAGAISYADDVNIDGAIAIGLSGMITARLGAQMASRWSGTALRKALGIAMLVVAPMVPAKSYFFPSSSSTKVTQNINVMKQEKSVTSLRVCDETFQIKHWIQTFPIELSCLGLFSGFAAGLFGVGGGAIVIPALTLLTDWTHYQALGTSLCAMIPTAMVGTYTHHRKGTVAMRIAPSLAVGSLVGAYLGGKLALKTDDMILRCGFSGILMMLGIRALR